MFKSSSNDFSEDDQSPLISEINIIPLVDVMLVLLIIFMVAAPLSLSKIDINLPDANATQSQKQKTDQTKLEPFVLTIDADANLYLDDQSVEIDSLQSVLQNKLLEDEKNKSKSRLIIRADRNVIYANVITAMSAGKTAGIEKISLVLVNSKD